MCTLIPSLTAARSAPSGGGGGGGSDGRSKGAIMRSPGAKKLRSGGAKKLRSGGAKGLRSTGARQGVDSLMMRRLPSRLRDRPAGLVGRASLLPPAAVGWAVSLLGLEI